MESTIGSVESISRPTFEENQVAGNEPGLRRSCRGSHPTRYCVEEFNVFDAIAEDDEELYEYLEPYSNSDPAVTDTDEDTDEDLPGFAEPETEDDEHEAQTMKTGSHTTAARAVTQRCHRNCSTSWKQATLPRRS